MTYDPQHRSTCTICGKTADPQTVHVATELTDWYGPLTLSGGYGSVNFDGDVLVILKPEYFAGHKVSVPYVQPDGDPTEHNETFEEYLEREGAQYCDECLLDYISKGIVEVVHASLGEVPATMSEAAAKITIQIGIGQALGLLKDTPRPAAWKTRLPEIRGRLETIFDEHFKTGEILAKWALLEVRPNQHIVNKFDNSNEQRRKRVWDFGREVGKQVAFYLLDNFGSANNDEEILEITSYLADRVFPIFMRDGGANYLADITGHTRDDMLRSFLRGIDDTMRELELVDTIFKDPVVFDQP